MPNLQVKDIDAKLYNSIRSLANREKRSISQEVVYILERYISQPETFKSNPTSEFLELSGSWTDDQPAEQIIKDIKKSRYRGKRFEDIDELFN